MESLINTRQESIYPMLDMDQAMDLALTKAKDIYLMHDQQEDSSSKQINELKVGDVLAQDVVAVDDLPPFHASVMDGYALSSVENYSNSAYTVVQSLKSLAGVEPQKIDNDTVEHLNAQNAVYVTTGAPVPPGYIAVIPIENIDKQIPSDGA